MRAAPFLVLLSLILAACSETTLRRDTLSGVDIEDREIIVSWVSVPPSGIDLVVLGAVGGDKPLELAAAREAAGRVAARRCLFDHATAIFPAVTYPGAQFAFRYVCGGAPPAPDMQEFREMPDAQEEIEN